jgi:hypothetical protein
VNDYDYDYDEQRRQADANDKANQWLRYRQAADVALQRLREADPQPHRGDQKARISELNHQMEVVDIWASMQVVRDTHPASFHYYDRMLREDTGLDPDAVRRDARALIAEQPAIGGFIHAAHPDRAEQLNVDTQPMLRVVDPADYFIENTRAAEQFAHQEPPTSAPDAGPGVA